MPSPTFANSSGSRSHTLSKDEARRIATNIAELPGLLLPRTGQDVPERPTHRDDESRDNSND